MCFSSSLTTHPFKRAENIKCTVMEIRTLLVHDSPFSVYCLMPQIKLYLRKMSVGDLRMLLLFFFFLAFTFTFLPITFWVFGICIKRLGGLIDRVSNPALCFKPLRVYGAELSSDSWNVFDLMLLGN